MQDLAIRYTERLAEAEALSSVGSRGDSYDNALAESLNGLYKAELIRRRGPWRTVEQVELATAAWVDFLEHPPPPLDLRRRPTHGVRGGILGSSGGAYRRCLNPTVQVSIKARAIH